MADEIGSLIDETIKKSADRLKKANSKTKDYYNSKGILMCGICHTPKQKKVDINVSNPFYEKYKNHLFPILCKCEIEKEKSESKLNEIDENKRLMYKLGDDGIYLEDYLKYDFKYDDKKNPDISKACIRYAKNFNRFLEIGKGIIFCGHIGTGKTFYACCIANEVIKQSHSVLVANIPSLIKYDKEGKYNIVNDIAKVSLLVIDDFGAEYSNAYVTDKIYEIIDARYRANKPLIITTNLKYKEMMRTEDYTRKRIYDRIAQMCYPILLLGESRRTDKAKKLFRYMNGILGV